MAYITIKIEGNPSQRYALDKTLTIGRAAHCSITIDDERLSRQHCRIEMTEQGWAILDLNSTNGTLVGGARITFHQLHDGDAVEIGRARVIFHAHGEPPKRPSDPNAPRSDETAPAARSPEDTLVDSRFPLPRVAPHEADVEKKNDGAATQMFRHPPARPKIVDQNEEQSPGPLRSLWRKLRGP